MIFCGLESLLILPLVMAVTLMVNESKEPKKEIVKPDPQVFTISINNSNENSNQHYLQYIKVNILPNDLKSSFYELKEWKLPQISSISKPLVLAGSGVALWLGVFIKLLMGSYQAKRSDTWGAWKEAIPEEILKELPQEELAQDLMLTIATRYQVGEKNSLNDFTAFAKFFNDMTIESERLQKYINLHEWLAGHYLSKIFPAQEIALELAIQKIKRLAYLQTLMPPRIACLADRIFQKS